MKLYLIAFVVLLFSQFALANCYHTRGVIEFGSGKTKAIIAKVNTCVSPWIQEPLAYIEETTQYRNNTTMVNGVRYLSERVIQEGYNATQRIMDKMQSYKVETVRGIATSVFRDQAQDANGTLNGALYLQNLSKKFNINISVLSQHDEAILATEAAISEVSSVIPNFNREDTIIWDIGGGSTQLVLPDERAEQFDGIFLGGFGSATMQEYVNSEIKRRTDDITCSANPVGHDHVAQLANYIKGLLSREISQRLINQISTRKIVIGIGGVHKYSSCELIYGTPHCSYTALELENAIKQFAGLTDEELYERGRCSEFKYCRDKITNSVLILSFMQAMNKDTILTAKASSKEGILVSPEYW